MGLPARNPEVLRFADCTLDLQTAELRRNGARAILQDQPFQILTALLENPGQLVTREELIKRLWPGDTHVEFDQSLNKAVARLREALGDRADEPRVIETLPRKGYRLIARIEGLDSPGARQLNADSAPPNLHHQANPVEATSSRRVRGRGRYLVAAATVLAVAASLRLLILRRDQPVVQASSIAIAVLPFQNTSPDKDIEYLRYAIADEVENALTFAPSLSVRPTVITRKYANSDVDFGAVGRELHVSKIVTGDYLKIGDQLQFNIEVVEAGNNRVLWHEAVKTPAIDMIQMRAELIQKIRLSLLPRLGISSVTDTRTSPHKEAAYDSYLRSVPFSSDPGPNAQGISWLESSVEADPNFAPAWEALGRRYNYAAEFANGGKSMTDLSDAALERALTLDPTRIVAAGELIAHRAEQRDLAKALAGARDLVKSNPNSAHAHYVLGYVYRYAGALELSAQECAAAAKNDPGNYDFHTCAWTFTELGQAERAMDFIGLAGGSEWAGYATLTVLIDKGKLSEAREVVHNLSVNPHHFRDLLSGCLQPRHPPDLDRLVGYTDVLLQAPIDPEILYYQGAILVFCGKQTAGTRLLSGAIAGNYCARSALRSDPLLAKLRTSKEYDQLLQAATECQHRAGLQLN